MSHDRIEQIGSSEIQHGPASNRVYLMKLDRRDFPEIVSEIADLADQNDYTKAFVKVPAYARAGFEQHGYRVEAKIPGFYRGGDDAYFMARYFDPNRSKDPAAEQVRQVLSAARHKAGSAVGVTLPPDCDCRPTTPADSEEMARLYRKVFASYPFAIHNPDYLADTMAGNLHYIGIWQAGQLVALASAEMDKQGSNAELTDFATLPEWRGCGLANHLLQRLEQEMAQIGITTCYTIARATSYGMNICFAANGYHFSGTLIKNTQISGGLESMNVWYKHLP